VVEVSAFVVVLGAGVELESEEPESLVSGAPDEVFASRLSVR
jgi:hypothetical protein